MVRNGRVRGNRIWTWGVSMTRTFELTDEEQSSIYLALDYYLESQGMDLPDDMAQELEILWRKFRPGANQ